MFQDVKLPKENLLPGVKGLKGPLSCLNNARYGISWGALGAAMACFHSAHRVLQESRIQFDRPIASFQLVQNKLAWMLREITKGQMLAWRLGRMKDAGTHAPRAGQPGQDEQRRHRACRLPAWRVMCTGQTGFSSEYPVMRHMANLESVYTYEGTHDIHNLVLGRWITGIAAFT